MEILRGVAGFDGLNLVHPHFTFIYPSKPGIMHGSAGLPVKEKIIEEAFNCKIQTKARVP